MEEKKCNICQTVKPLSDYNKSSQHKNGYRNYCRNCQKEMSKKYSDRLGDQIKERKRKWSKDNQDKVKESRKKTYQTHGKRISKERYEKVKSDPIQYLKILMRRRIRGILQSKNLNKKLPSKDIVGCEYNELKLYLESKFIDGMNWENQGSWHIDHIIPLSSAQTEEEIYKLCHYTNLQPLWALDNIRKSNKIL
jgi:hypothetical protein